MLNQARAPLSFQLPRRPPALRFTGEVRSFAPEPLARARLKHPPTADFPRSPPPSESTRVREPTSIPPPRASTPARRGELLPPPPPSRRPTAAMDTAGVRRTAPSLSDEETTMFERDDEAIERAKAKAALAKKALAIPNFRGPAPAFASPPVLRPLPPPPARAGTLPPVVFWVIAGIFAGIVSYWLAPAALAQVESVVASPPR